jgi:hypothetical protein
VEDGLFQDSGVCTIELPSSGQNLTLAIDPAFKVGDAIVRYSVEPTDPEFNGFGTVRVTDCAGNFCDVPIELFTGDVCDYIDAPLCMGDANGDGDVTPEDVGLIKFNYGGSGDFALCHYDVNCDGSINAVDVGLAKYFYATCEDPCFLNP